MCCYRNNYNYCKHQPCNHINVLVIGNTKKMEERESIGTHNIDETVSVSTKKRKLSNSSTSQSQLDALKTIYTCLGGTNWVRKDNWLLNDQSEEWQGITMKEGNVLILELSQNNLQGRLDDPLLIEAFAKLTTLEQLWMSENAGLTGNLPAIFADESIFPNLSILDVGSNNLRGSLHPSFSAKRKTPFSWFDTSGNQLTSYFRYSSNNDKHEINVDGIGPINTPLDNVHIATNLLTKSQCKNLVDLAIQYTAIHGWTTDRHKEYKTTDIDISICGDKLLDLCNGYCS